MTSQVAVSARALADLPRHPWRKRTVILLFVATPLLVFFALHVRLGAPLTDMTRDIAAVADVPWWAGFLSSLGAFYWISAAVICVYSAVLLATRRSPHDARFLLVSGLGLAVLGLDDFFMFHESIAPSVGVSERAVAAAYVIGMAGYVIAYRSRFRGAWRWWGLVGIAALGASLAIDQLTGNGPVGTVVEDLCKWAGIASVCILLACVSFTLTVVGAPATTEADQAPPR